jgi:spore maturation protein CgeB
MAMRVLVLEPGPAFSVLDVCRGWEKGLAQAGCHVATFNFGDRLDFYTNAHVEKDGGYVQAFSTQDAVQLAAKGIETACYELWPDLVVAISGFFLPPPLYELLRARGHKVALIHTESPYEDTRQMTRAALADVNIINDPTHLESFRAVNPKTWYLPAAYDPDVHHPGPPVPDLACDFGFVGTGFDSRVRFFEQVNWTGVDVALAGNWAETDDDSPLRKFLVHDLAECFPNEQAVGLYRSAKVSANLYRKEAQAPGLEQGWAMSPREVELASCGTFFLRESRPEGDEVLSMLPTFDGPDEFEAELRWWLTHDDERADRACQARAAVADRSFITNATALLRHLAE